jgi:hypothetical protein
MGIVLTQKSLPRSGVDIGAYIRGSFHKAELSYGRLFGSHIRYGASTGLMMRFIKVEAKTLAQKLIEGELKRRIKKDPAVEFDEPEGIFRTSDAQLDPKRNIVETLWTF